MTSHPRSRRRFKMLPVVLFELCLAINLVLSQSPAATSANQPLRLPLPPEFTNAAITSAVPVGVSPSFQQSSEEKPGTCPQSVSVRDYGWCVSQCRTDMNCSYDQKCCFNGCGTMCMAPTAENDGPGAIMASDIQGFGNSKMSQEALLPPLGGGNPTLPTPIQQEPFSPPNMVQEQPMLQTPRYSSGAQVIWNTAKPQAVFNKPAPLNPYQAPTLPVVHQCPPTNFLPRSCEVQCNQDTDCGSSNTLCCSSGCGKLCISFTDGQSPKWSVGRNNTAQPQQQQQQQPVVNFMPQQPHNNQMMPNFPSAPVTLEPEYKVIPKTNEKPGTCPSLGYGTGGCVQTCSADQDCEFFYKCCSNGCTMRCVRPVFNNQEDSVPQTTQPATTMAPPPPPPPPTTAKPVAQPAVPRPLPQQNPTGYAQLANQFNPYAPQNYPMPSFNQPDIQQNNQQESPFAPVTLPAWNDANFPPPAQHQQQQQGQAPFVPAFAQPQPQRTTPPTQTSLPYVPGMGFGGGLAPGQQLTRRTAPPMRTVDDRDYGIPGYTINYNQQPETDYSQQVGGYGYVDNNDNMQSYTAALEITSRRRRRTTTTTTMAPPPTTTEELTTAITPRPIRRTTTMTTTTTMAPTTTEEFISTTQDLPEIRPQFPVDQYGPFSHNQQPAYQAPPQTFDRPQSHSPNILLAQQGVNVPETCIVHNQSSIDPHHFTMAGSYLQIFTSLPITCTGQVVAWQFVRFSVDPDATFHASVWRRVNSRKLEFELIGSNRIVAGKDRYRKWKTYVVPRDQRINVRIGQFLGIFYDSVHIDESRMVVPYMDGGYASPNATNLIEAGVALNTDLREFEELKLVSNGLVRVTFDLVLNRWRLPALVAYILPKDDSDFQKAMPAGPGVFPQGPNSYTKFYGAPPALSFYKRHRASERVSPAAPVRGYKPIVTEPLPPPVKDEEPLEDESYDNYEANEASSNYEQTEEPLDKATSQEVPETTTQQVVSTTRTPQVQRIYAMKTQAPTHHPGHLHHHHHHHHNHIQVQNSKGVAAPVQSQMISLDDENGEDAESPASEEEAERAVSKEEFEQERTQPKVQQPVQQPPPQQYLPIKAGSWPAVMPDAMPTMTRKPAVQQFQQPQTLPNQQWGPVVTKPAAMPPPRFDTQRMPTPEGCLEMVDPGKCHTQIVRYYFDNSLLVCKPFIFTGCGGNSNNFKSQSDCESNCMSLQPPQQQQQQPQRPMNNNPNMIFSYPQSDYMLRRQRHFDEDNDGHDLMMGHDEQQHSEMRPQGKQRHPPTDKRRRSSNAQQTAASNTKRQARRS